MEKEDEPTAEWIMEKFGVQSRHWDDIEYVKDVLVRLYIKSTKQGGIE